MKRFFSAVLTLSLSLGASAPARAQDSTQEIRAEHAAQRAVDLTQEVRRQLGAGDWAFQFEFRDDRTGQTTVLASSRTEVMVRPASTLKLFTGWAGYVRQAKTNAYLGKMLKESDNAMAASTLVALGGLSALKNFYLQQGLPISSSNFAPVDGNGLSYSNRVTVSIEMALLRKIHSTASYRAFRELLAKPLEKDGSLEERLGDLEGKVFAKTGTLQKEVNSSLAGYIDVEGGTVVFSLLGNNIPVSADLERRLGVTLSHQKTVEAARERIDDVVHLIVRTAESR